jgi:Trk K+ transport system NAD-binding subunit
MVGIFARQYNTPLILARLRQEHYRVAYDLAGIGMVFSEYDFLLNVMLNAIEDPDVKQVIRLGDGSTEIASLGLAPDSPLLGRPVNALWEHNGFPHGALVLGVLRASDQSFVLPREAPVLHAGDDVLIIGTHEDIHAIAQLASRPRRWRR